MAAVCNALHNELDVRVIALGFTEAVRRGVSLRNCLRSGRELAEVHGDPLLDELTNELRALAVDDTCVLAPLLPVHLDHALTRAAAERATPANVAYYEDRPYVTLHSDLRDRLCAGLYPRCASSVSDASAMSRILERLSSFIGSRQLARMRAAYTDGYLERIWFREPQHATPERTPQ